MSSNSHRLMRDSLRMLVEQRVSAHLGQSWRAQKFTDLNDLASHPCAILSNGSYAVFAKLGEAAHAQEQFEVEQAGLQLLAERAGVRTPTPIGTITVEGGAVMLLEAIPAIERGPQQWREIGQALARIHKVKGDQCGLATQGYFGPLYQDNRPIPDWPTFYAERRLWPRLMSAIDAGHLPTSAIRQIEKLISRVPELCGPTIKPALLHGDAQQNNFISTITGAIVIDPAVSYGHPEFDLAYLDYFQPVPAAVFDGYRDELLIDAGFSERRDLWRVYGYLAVVTVAGQDYMGQLMDAVQKYL